MVGKLWKLAAVVAMVAILGVAAVGVVAYAQEATTGSSAVWDFGQKVKEAIAGALGISVEKYEETVTAAEKQVLADAVAAGQITQEQADRMQKRLDEGGGFGFPGMGHGPGEMKSVLLTVAAEKLGMTEAELRTELQSGKSITDVAKEKGVDTQVISDAYLAQIKADLDAQVAAGTLTQAEADARLQQKTEALPDRLTGTWQEMGGRGGRGHGGGPENAPASTGEGGL
jgi:hypothetical protein